MPKSTHTPSHQAIHRLGLYDRPRRVASAKSLHRSPVTSQEPSICSDIFVDALITRDPHQPEEGETKPNNKLELCLFVDVIPGKSKGCFHGLDTFILMLSVWSPLPVPLHPMATVQLDRFVAVDRDIPSAPLWAARVQGTKTSPLKLFRTPHWVREQLKIMLSSPTAKPDATTSRDCSFLLEEISALIVTLERFQLSRELSKTPRLNPPPRPRPIRRQIQPSDLGSVFGALGEMGREDGSHGPGKSGLAKPDM